MAYIRPYPNIIPIERSPYSKTNMDDILYTIVHSYYNIYFSAYPERWVEIEANMWRNYNETFRDLLVTFLNILDRVHN